MAKSKPKVEAPIAPPRRLVRRVAWAISWVLAVLTGIVTLSGPISNLMNPNAADYALLRTIHVGNSLDSVAPKLGVPDDSDEETRAGLIAHTYVRDKFAALVIVNPWEEVVLYSVIACDPSFTPTFDLPSGSQVKLNSYSLVEASAAFAAPGTSQNDLPTVHLSYTHSPKGQNANQLVEYAEATGRFRFQQYIGVSGSCAPTGFGGETTKDPTVFQGPLASAPPEVIAFRSTALANFYTEAEDSFELDALGRLAVDLTGDDFIYESSLDILVAPDEDDLGVAFGTRWRQ